MRRLVQRSRDLGGHDYAGKGIYEADGGGLEHGVLGLIGSMPGAEGRAAEPSEPALPDARAS